MRISHTRNILWIKNQKAARAQALPHSGIYNKGLPTTFGGEAVALTGEWHGMPTEVRAADDSLTFHVAPASAALVFVGPFPGAEELFSRTGDEGGATSFDGNF